jgi:FG-GAP-like repeat
MKPLFLFVALFCANLLGAQGFTNIATELGVAYSFGDPDYGGGVSFADFNQDGWDDLTYTSGPGSPLRFHINTGGGYEEIAAPVNNTTETKQPIWVDYDNDGDLDLYVTSYQLNRLYRNDGNLSMIDVTASCGFDDPLNQSFNATWFDYDRDGYLDLMTAHRYSHLVGNLTLYHNLGNGNFEDVTDVAGVGSGMGNSVLAMASLDFNNDGWQDVYVGQDYQQGNLLLKNMGDGTFMNIAASSNTNIENNTMTVAVGDFNNDGWMDLFVTDTGYDGCSMLVNNGDETFDDVATPMNTVLHEFTWGAVYFDADNDMDLDLHVDGKNNSPWSSYMFENPGSGNPFGIVNESWGFGTDNARSIGCAIGDYDGDGYPELAKNCSYNTINTFWRNDFDEHHYLSIDLVGVESNMHAVGAVVWVTSGGVTQVRRVGCGEGFSSQNSYTQFFGRQVVL